LGETLVVTVIVAVDLAPFATTVLLVALPDADELVFAVCAAAGDAMNAAVARNAISALTAFLLSKRTFSRLCLCKTMSHARGAKVKCR
jgi:hypothetical protein